jgi:hypothetical protein
MTEAEWLACSDPWPMLQFLGDVQADDRKLRLFACACCRRIWHLLSEQGAREAAELAERFADRLVGDKERSDARREAQLAAQSRAVTPTPTAPKWQRRAASAVYYGAARGAWEAANGAFRLAVDALVWRAGGYECRDAHAVSMSEHAAQAAALRDIFGNPFRPVGLDPAWRDGDGAVARLAQAIYDERRFEASPILADALEDAGCTDPAILAHCRGPGPHVRGCWVVDLLLGRG